MLMLSKPYAEGQGGWRADVSKTAADLVYHRLWEDIRHGVVPPGSHLTEEGLAEKFGVSRTPVREALRRLAQDGLVERSSRGMVVPPISPERMREIYPIVACLEGLAARIAAERKDPDVVALLRDLQEQMRRCFDDGDIERFLELNAQLHGALIDRCGNASLIATLQRFRAPMRHYRTIVLHMPGRAALSVEEHARIVDAIEAGDAPGAEAAMRAHIEGSARILSAAFRALDMPPRPGR